MHSQMIGMIYFHYGGATLKRLLYSFYMKAHRNPLLATLFSLLYTRLRPAFILSSEILVAPQPEKPLVAFICDEMTWQDYASECGALYLTPNNWRKSLEQYRPDILFCESTWSGIAKFPDCWRGKIYKNAYLWYNNRREILNILSYCREQTIPSVFWNKEDPGYFDDKMHDFCDTACHFDRVLTTAEECIPKYRALGVDNVQMWSFGFAPRLFYPPPKMTQRDNVAVFAGGWYANIPGRCRDMETLFQMVLDNSIELVIYDRHSGGENPQNRFPVRWQPYLRPVVAFESLGDIFRKSRYVLNVNSAPQSKTMFARRVYEAMACGSIVISTNSSAMETMFPGRVWFCGQPFDRSLEGEIAEANIKDVFAHHSCGVRMDELWKMLNIEGIEDGNSEIITRA